MILYKTVMEVAHEEQIIEKSRFIAYVSPVESRDEAEAFFAEIRKKHSDATHNVPAMVLGDKFQIQWGSDDGEPQGTSGAPIVQMLVKEGITNVAVVVTRYFGGIKLGTGGLVRAYTSSVRLAINSAKICNVVETASIKLKTEYTYLNKIQNITEKYGAKVKDILYEDMVTITITCNEEKAQEVKKTVTNITGDKQIWLKEDKSIEKVEIQGIQAI